MFERSVLGLDIGSWSVKVAELSSGLRGAKFVGFSELELPRNAPSEEIEATLQLWMQSRNLSPETLITALSTSHLTQRHLRFPFAGAKRVAAALAFEIDEELPLPLSNFMLAHEQVLTGSDQTDVLVAIAPRADVEEHLASLRRMELEPRVIECEGASLANLSSFLGLDDVSRLILDIGHSKTNLCLLVDGKPIALRRIPLAGLQLSEALARDLGIPLERAEQRKHELGIFERGSAKPVSAGVLDVLERLAREVQRSVQSVVGDPLDPVYPTEVLLAGGSARLDGLAGYFAERTALPTRVLAARRGSDGGDRFADAGPALFAQAAALALRGSSTDRITQSDFRQGDLAYTPDLSGLRPQLRFTVGLFGLFLGLWVASASLGSWLENRRVAQAQAQLESIYQQLFPGSEVAGAPLEALEQRAAETRELAAHLGVTGKGLSVLEILHQISALAPESLEISLDELTIERQSVVARGHSADFVSADQLKAELSKFEGFQRVLVTDVKTDARRGGKTFTVSIRLGGSDE